LPARRQFSGFCGVRLLNGGCISCGGRGGFRVVFWLAKADMLA